MDSNRKPSEDEKRLIGFLIQKGTIKISSEWSVNLLVRPLNDGGMGSLLLLPEGVEQPEDHRSFGEQVSECQFTDKDGVDVIASLNIDKEGRLFELDIWKTDFTSLISIPEILK